MNKELILGYIYQYEQRIENIQWHIETNGWAMTDSEKELTKLRIEDYRVFIDKLKSLM